MITTRIDNLLLRSFVVLLLLLSGPAVTAAQGQQGPEYIAIDHIEFFVTDLERSLQFYTRLFGNDLSELINAIETSVRAKAAIVARDETETGELGPGEVGYITAQIKEVAETAGVSRSTASRALTGHGYVAPQVREQPREGANLLGMPGEIQLDLIADGVGPRPRAEHRTRERADQGASSSCSWTRLPGRQRMSALRPFSSGRPSVQ